MFDRGYRGWYNENNDYNRRISMQKLQRKCVSAFEYCFNSRTAVMVLTFFMMAFCANVHTRWGKSLFHFFILPVQIGMSYVYIRDKAIHMGGVFKLVCVSLLWLLMSQMLVSNWSLGGMIRLWTMFGCWIFALFIPKKSTMEDLRKEIFAVGMVYIVCFLPFVLIALFSVFTGKLIYVPWDHTPLGVQEAGNFGTRVRIMMNPNRIGVILLFNIFFSIFGIVNRKRFAWRAFFVFVIIVNLMAFCHVMSRTCIMGLAASFSLLGFRFVYQKLGKRKILRIAAGLLACVLLFFAVIEVVELIYKTDVNVARRLNGVNRTIKSTRLDSYGTFDATGTGRGEIWVGCIEFLKNNPLNAIIGFGEEDIMQLMMQDPEIIGVDDSWHHVHSAYLDAVMRGGGVYLLMVLIFLVILIKPAWQLGMEKESAETKGMFVIPMFVVAMLVMSVSEIMIFVDRSHTNYMFMAMCGYILHYARLRREGKLAQ